MDIAFFDMRAELAPLRPEIDAAIARVLDHGAFIGGPEVERFERELAASTRALYAVGTSSGTDALLVTFMALGIAAGDEVITTPLTFFATAGSIARLGARPVFADVDAETLTLDPDAAASACGRATRAIVPVNLFGYPAALPDVQLPTIEDSAQSLGGTAVRGRAAALSFFPTKTVGALGDAGAVLTDDGELAARIALLRTHGAKPKYHHLALGGNFRLDALQAAVLSVKLTRLQRWVSARRQIAARYRELLTARGLLADVTMPADHRDHTYNVFVIRVPRRDALREHLARRGIATEVYYPAPLHLQPCFADLGYRPGAFPNAEVACHELLALPIYPTLAANAVERVVTCIAEFFGR